MIIRRIAAFAAFIGGAVLIGFRGGTAGYTLFYFVTALPIMAFVYSKTACRSLYAACSLRSAAVLKGTGTVCQVTLKNEGILPLTDVRLTFTSGQAVFDGVEGTEMTSLSPRETVRYDMALTCRHCGRTRVGFERAETRDFLGMFRHVTANTDIINILPRVMHLENLVIAPSAETEKQRSSLGYGVHDVPDGQLRLYAAGDDVRHIHWKVSALQGRLMVRSFVPQPKAGVTLIPDSRDSLPAGEEGWTTADSILEGTLAIADYFRRRGMTLSVLPDRVRQVTVTAGSGFDRLYAICSDGYFIGESRPDALLREDMAIGGSGGRYVLMTWELDEEFVRTCSACADVGAEITVIYLGDGAGEQISALTSPDSRVRLVQVRSGEDIFDVLGGVSAGEAAG